MELYRVEIQPADFGSLDGDPLIILYVWAETQEKAEVEAFRSYLCGSVRSVPLNWDTAGT